VGEYEAVAPAWPGRHVPFQDVRGIGLEAVEAFLLLGGQRAAQVGLVQQLDIGG
jgi:hypothetical protein